MKEEKKNFIKKPEYIGGKIAMKKFINDNLKYPDDAVKAKIEGVVAVGYDVNDEGEVISTKIIKSLYPSCDEEATRIVKMLKYGKVMNRGLRVTAHYKINIYFRLTKSLKAINETTQIQYVIEPAKQQQKQKNNNSEEKYNYTIEW